MVNWYEYNHEKPNKDKILENKNKSEATLKVKRRVKHALDLFVLYADDQGILKDAMPLDHYKKNSHASDLLWLSIDAFNDGKYASELKDMRDAIHNQVSIGVYYIQKDEDGEFTIKYKSKVIDIQEDDGLVESPHTLKKQYKIEVDQMKRCKGPRISDFEIVATCEGLEQKFHDVVGMSGLMMRKSRKSHAYI